MAFDQFLADRIQFTLKSKTNRIEEKRMFGGLCFMVDNKMCVGVVKNEMMARVDPEDYEELIKLPGTREMDFTNRPMKGFIFVQPEALDSSESLDFWVEKCLKYNPKAKSSKK